MSKISDAIKKFAHTVEDVIVLSIFKDQIKWMTAVYADASRGLLVKGIFLSKGALRVATLPCRASHFRETRICFRHMPM